MPPPAVGSGKFGTPRERMQSANATAVPALFEPGSRLALVDDPQAATTTTHAMAATESTTVPIAERTSMQAVLADGR